MAKIPGYAGQYLEVDMTNKTYKAVPLTEQFCRDYIGGRAMATRMLLDRMGANWAKIDPLGPDNILIVNTGPLNPFVAGKLNYTFKSPLSYGAVGSSVSSDMCADLKFAGWDGIIFTGKAAGPTTVLIEDGKVTFKDASNIWGKDRTTILETLIKDYGTTVTPMYIGVGGEKLVRYATAQSGPYRAAGRGGSGAAMGSKNLKAIVVRHSGPAPDVADPKGVDQWMEWIRVNPPFVRYSMHEYGTTGGIYTTGNVRSSEPVRNWQSEWHDEKAIQGDFFAGQQWIRRYWGDYACTVACSKLGCVRDPTSKRRGTVAELPDYESGALLGTNLGIFKTDEMLYATDLGDIYGLDLISLGNVLGWVCELQERGILTAADLGGIQLKWGDATGFDKLTEMIAKRQGIGDILAEGEELAAKKIGKGSEKYAVHVKGIELGAHGSRSLKDKNEVSYPVSTHGGDHTSNPSNEKTVEGAQWTDSLVQCSFLGLTEAQQIAFVNAVTGFNITPELKNNLMMKRWATAQMMTLRLGGRLADTDINPPRYYEPLPDGPFKGMAVDKKIEVEKVRAYYKLLGWDTNGIPTSAALKEYGLEAFDGLMAPLRKA